MPALRRDVFLDTDPAPAAIEAQWRRLLARARTRGTAVGIGHPYAATLALLERELPGLAASGVVLVPLSSLLQGARAVSRDPIERSLEIEQAQLRGFARSIAEVEWLLLILVVLYLFIGNPSLARSPSVLAVLLGFAAFVLAVPLRAAVRRQRAREARDRDSRDARVPDGCARIRRRRR